MSELRHATHDEVPPLIDGNCTVLLLGSMLSPKSAQERFYYAHPQNRFWRVLSGVYGRAFPSTREERAELALSCGVALWDVIYSCDIVGASDSTIKNVVYNDIDGLLSAYKNITRVYATGGKAFELLRKYAKTANNNIIASAGRLPSTSPLNCGTSLSALIDAYSVIRS